MLKLTPQRRYVRCKCFKRQLTYWYTASVVNNHTTKFVIDQGLDPLLVTWVHFGVCSILSIREPIVIVSPKISIYQFMGFLCGNTTCQSLSIFYINALKTLEPFIMMVYYRQFGSFKKTLGVILCGIGISLLTPINDFKFVIVPFILLMISSIFQSMKSIELKTIMENEGVSGKKIFKDTSKLSCICLLPFVLPLFKMFTINTFIMLMISSISFYVQNVSAFTVLDKVDNVRFSFLVLLKKIIILVSSFKFNSLMGLMFIISGIVIYN